MNKIIKLFFIIFIFTTQHIYSQAILLPGEEAPESIFSINKGGTDVDLYLLGSWETDLIGGVGYSWSSEDPSIKKSSFPGMASGLQLNHSPDIFISLWIMNRYFFETSFIDDYELNTILFGYESVDDNFIQSVRVGNTDIGFGDYSYLSIPEASADSMGGMALFKNDKSEHQLMIRYDPAEMQKKSFIGQYEVDPSRVDLSNYVTGRYFILPDNNVDNLKVYIQDNSGPYTGQEVISSDIYKYRLADSDDAIISSEEGIVFFRESLNKRVIVHYTKSGLDVGNIALGVGSLAKDSAGQIDITGANVNFSFSGTNYLGIIMNTLESLIDGSETALVLYEPGAFSPFEMLSVYSLPYLIPGDPALFKTSLTDINLSIGERVSTSTTFEDYMVRVLYNGESYRDPANRYPLADSIDSDTLIYEPDKLLNGSPPDKELLFQRLYPSSGYYLGDNVLDGSVSVTMNGLDEYRYTFNPDSGNVSFLFPVPADAQIDIKYRTLASTGTSGDLLIALGSKFNFSDNFSMDTGLGLRWNVLDSSYIEQPGDASGSIIGTAGLSYKGEHIDLELDAGLSVYSPNTTGILRLAGMNRGGFSVPVSADFLYPSAPSVNPAVTSGTRGKLYYKDYHEYDSSGSSTLKDYSWALPANQIYSYTDGGRTGPYIAGTGSEIDGDTAVFDYDLAASEWTGGRIPLTLGSEPIDLSSTQSISLKWKHITVVDNIKIYLRIGKLAEDLDNDGILDKEISIYDSGFNFNDLPFNMKVGLSPDSDSGNDQIDTEDLDGNSILDGEGSNLVLTMEDSRLDFTEPGSSWETLTINLTPLERETLKAVTGFEIIIIDGGSASSGRLFIGDIIFSGSSFVVKSIDEQEVNVKEVNELYSSLSSPLLTTSHPEVSIFSAGSGAQNITEINWEATDSSWDILDDGTWTTTSFVESVDLSDYNKISFYMKTPSTAPDDITFSLTNPSGNGVSFKFEPVESPEWIKYTVDYRKGSLEANGTSKSILTWLKRDFDADNANRLSLSATCTSAGTLLIDEVHMEDPVVGISGAASTNFNYSYPGTILSYNKTPVISNFNFGNSSSIKGSNFGSGFTDNKDSTIYTASNFDFSLLTMGIIGNLNLQWQKTKLYSSPGLSLTLPFFENKIVVTDSYSEINLPLTNSTFRKNSVAATLGFTSLMFSADTSVSEESLIRNWEIDSSTVWEGGSKLISSIDFRMISNEDPYNNMNTFEKFRHSYSLYLPGSILNDRITGININPVFSLGSVSLGINEGIISNVYGTDERVINTNHSLSVDAGFSFNPDSLKQWNLVTGYTKSIQGLDNIVNDNNFFTDTVNSVQFVGTQHYYYTGIPFWEILFPDFATQFEENTYGLMSAEYNPVYSLQISKLSGSRPRDIFLPSVLNMTMARNLNRDFDSLTDSLNINFETRATALNVFGKLGTNPLFNWYQTEEITNILSINGEFRSYGTEIFTDPVFSFNYSLYLNFNLSPNSSINFQSNHNWEWIPLIWNSISTGSYNWKVVPIRTIGIPLFHEENANNKPYFEHKEKFTLSTSTNFDLKENSFTITVNHFTDLIFTEKGKISVFAGAGFDKKTITSSDSISKYYLLGIEAGISAMLTF